MSLKSAKASKPTSTSGAPNWEAYDKSYKGSGETIPFEVAAGIAEWAGLPGTTYAQIAQGESTLRPGAESPDGGYGLWQMTPRVQSPELVKQWEKGDYFNPYHNALMAKLLAGDGTGVENYYGTSHVSNPNAHWNGPVPPKTFLAVGNPYGAVDLAKDTVGGALEMVDLVGDFVGTILNFRKLGELAAKALAWFIKVISRAIWEYVIAPVLHWNERAVSYYWDAYFARDKALLGSDSAIYKNAGWVTVGFWAFGYGILWAKAETNDEGRTRLGFAESPRQSMLGKTIQRTQQTAAKRHVTSAKKAAEKASTTKPAAVHASKSPIKQTRTLTVTRKRPVQVGGSTTKGRTRAQLAPAN